MVRFAAAVVAIALGAQLASAIIVDLDCGNTLVGGKGNGEYSGVCVRDQTFTNADGTNWNFLKSKVTNTAFKEVTFKGQHNFQNTEWDDVRFSECSFQGTGREDTSFKNGTMKSVTFDKCKFEETAKIIFESLNMDDVTFNDCTFLTDTTFKSLTGKDLKFEKGTVGGFDNSFQFESATIDGLFFKDVSVTSNLRFQSSRITKLETSGSTTMQDFYCGKATNGVMSAQSTFADADFEGLKLENFFCGGSTWNNMKLSDVQVQKQLAFGGAVMKDIKWDGVKRDATKTTKESCALLDLSYATIKDGDQISGITSCNATFRGVKLLDPVNFEGMDVNDVDVFNFRDAEFAQTCISNVSCVTLCKTEDKNPICKCGSDKDSKDCAKKGSNVNDDINEGQPGGGSKEEEEDDGACFPADSTVTTHEGKLVRMEDLSHSHRIAVGGGRHSEVFFFGHRSPSHLTSFVHIQTTSNAKELRLSPGHYLYANGKLVTARSIVVGDKLETGDSQAVSVTSIRTQLARGLYAPATLHGNLVVDGIVVSSYTDALHPRVAHTMLGPLRVLHQMGLKSISSGFSLLNSYSGAPVARFFGFAGPALIERI